MVDNYEFEDDDDDGDEVEYEWVKCEEDIGDVLDFIV